MFCFDKEYMIGKEMGSNVGLFPDEYREIYEFISSLSTTTYTEFNIIRNPNNLLYDFDIGKLGYMEQNGDTLYWKLYTNPSTINSINISTLDSSLYISFSPAKAVYLLKDITVPIAGIPIAPVANVANASTVTLHISTGTVANASTVTTNPPNPMLFNLTGIIFTRNPHITETYTDIYTYEGSNWYKRESPAGATGAAPTGAAGPTGPGLSNIQFPFTFLSTYNNIAFLRYEINKGN